MICVSIANMGRDACLSLVADFRVVEIRLDSIELTAEDMAAISQKARCWIATCRPGTHTPEKRMEQLSMAIMAGASYVDIEYESVPVFREPLVKLARKKGCKVMISYHDYKQTPNRETLCRIIRQSFNMGADRVKLATMANSKADSARILSLYDDFDRLLAFAMGKEGRISRVAAPMLGADFTYASAGEGAETAPGQFTASQLETIYDIVGILPSEK